MKTRLLPTIALFLTFLVGPGSPVNAGGGGCSFDPDEIQVTIDPALFDTDGPIDPSNFDPETAIIDIVTNFFGTNAWTQFTITVGGKDYTLGTPFEAPPISSDNADDFALSTSIAWGTMLPGAGGALLDQLNTDFVNDFDDADGWMSALMNPDSYPVSLTIKYAAVIEGPYCSITFTYSVGEGSQHPGGRLWDFDLSHLLDRAKPTALPHTL